jgi:hypothetical protein
MRYRIEPPGWPVAGALLPAGTIVDTSDPDCLVKGLTPPLNSQALDEEAWRALLAAYPDHRHLLGGGWQ